MTALSLLPLILLAFIFIQRNRYEIRMLKLGIGVLAEAQTIKAEYPDDYEPYYMSAVRTLNDHGVGELVAALPKVVG